MWHHEQWEKRWHHAGSQLTYYASKPYLETESNLANAARQRLADVIRDDKTQRSGKAKMRKRAMSSIRAVKQTA